jgi:hypothetical protein
MDFPRPPRRVDLADNNWSACEDERYGMDLWEDHPRPATVFRRKDALPQCSYQPSLDFRGTMFSDTTQRSHQHQFHHG